ncbi:transposase [Candidatus Paracaedibacter symbiosus]|uniref:transposase n=1 Tax=Candidatus Paracaedibacter symbiosus TaxID=244582 RepID=UPI00068EB3E6|nr:transposase [Candidatus Paracaedibacter symbiosus]
MQGIHYYQPQLFSYVSTESLIPKSHLLKRIDRLIDCSFIRELTSFTYCPNNGRPSIDPQVYFRMILVGYLYGISSDRRLCEEIHFNLAYRWFCCLTLNDRVPHHSSLTRIRDRYGENIFQKFFNHIVKVCQKMGLVKGECLMTDSTLIKAKASLDSLANITPHPEKINSLKGNGINPPTPRKLSNSTHQSVTDSHASLAGS